MDNPTFTNPILPGFYPDPSICRAVEYEQKGNF